MSQASRLRALEAEGLLHPRADAVTAPLFAAGRVLPGRGQGAGQVRDAARASGRRGAGDRGGGGARLLPGRVLPGGRGVRAGRDGGLLDERRGRRGPVKLTAEIVEFMQAAPPPGPGAELAEQVADRFGVRLHRRTVERARGGERPVVRRRFWPVRGGAGRLRNAAGARAGHGRLPDSLAAARFARRGVAGLIAWPSAEPVFVAELLGAARPAWTPHDDPRLDGAGRRVRPAPRRRRRGRATARSTTAGGHEKELPG